eukprot:Rmarinus@m.11340
MSLKFWKKNRKLDAEPERDIVSLGSTDASTNRLRALRGNGPQEDALGKGKGSLWKGKKKGPETIESAQSQVERMSRRWIEFQTAKMSNETDRDGTSQSQEPELEAPPSANVRLIPISSVGEHLANERRKRTNGSHDQSSGEDAHHDDLADSTSASTPSTASMAVPSGETSSAAARADIPKENPAAAHVPINTTAAVAVAAPVVLSAESASGPPSVNANKLQKAALDSTAEGNGLGSSTASSEAQGMAKPSASDASAVKDSVSQHELPSPSPTLPIVEAVQLTAPIDPGLTITMTTETPGLGSTVGLTPAASPALPASSSGSDLVKGMGPSRPTRQADSAPAAPTSPTGATTPGRPKVGPASVVLGRRAAATKGPTSSGSKSMSSMSALPAENTARRKNSGGPARASVPEGDSSVSTAGVPFSPGSEDISKSRSRGPSLGSTSTEAETGLVLPSSSPTGITPPSPKKLSPGPSPPPTTRTTSAPPLRSTTPRNSKPGAPSPSGRTEPATPVRKVATSASRRPGDSQRAPVTRPTLAPSPTPKPTRAVSTTRMAASTQRRPLNTAQQKAPVLRPASRPAASASSADASPATGRASSMAKARGGPFAAESAQESPATGGPFLAPPVPEESQSLSKPPAVEDVLSSPPPERRDISDRPFEEDEFPTSPGTSMRLRSTLSTTDAGMQMVHRNVELEAERRVLSRSQAQLHARLDTLRKQLETSRVQCNRVMTERKDADVARTKAENELRLVSAELRTVKDEKQQLEIRLMSAADDVKRRALVSEEVEKSREEALAWKRVASRHKLEADNFKRDLDELRLEMEARKEKVGPLAAAKEKEELDPQLRHYLERRVRFLESQVSNYKARWLRSRQIQQGLEDEVAAFRAGGENAQPPPENAADSASNPALNKVRLWLQNSSFGDGGHPVPTGPLRTRETQTYNEDWSDLGSEAALPVSGADQPSPSVRSGHVKMGRVGAWLSQAQAEHQAVSAAHLSADPPAGHQSSKARVSSKRRTRGPRGAHSQSPSPSPPPPVPDDDVDEAAVPIGGRQRNVQRGPAQADDVKPPPGAGVFEVDLDDVADRSSVAPPKSARRSQSARTSRDSMCSRDSYLSRLSRPRSRRAPSTSVDDEGLVFSGSSKMNVIPLSARQKGAEARHVAQLESAVQRKREKEEAEHRQRIRYDVPLPPARKISKAECQESARRLYQSGGSNKLFREEPVEDGLKAKEASKRISKDTEKKLVQRLVHRNTAKLEELKRCIRLDETAECTFHPNRRSASAQSYRHRTLAVNNIHPDRSLSRGKSLPRSRRTEELTQRLTRPKIEEKKLLELSDRVEREATKELTFQPNLSKRMHGHQSRVLRKAGLQSTFDRLATSSTTSASHKHNLSRPLNVSQVYSQIRSRQPRFEVSM